MTVADVGTDDGAMAPRADRPKRRTFTAEFKAAILAEYDAADRSGRGEILRREGLYTSHIIEWRKAAAAGSLSGLGSKPRDPCASGWGETPALLTFALHGARTDQY